MSDSLDRIASALSDMLTREGISAQSVTVGAYGARVDVSSKVAAEETAFLLRAAGARDVRILFERKGLWLVVGQLPE